MAINLSGRVTDSHGNGINGATVKAIAASTQTEYTTTTAKLDGMDGRWQLTDLPDDIYRIVTVAKGKASEAYPGEAQFSNLYVQSKPVINDIQATGGLAVTRDGNTVVLDASGLAGVGALVHGLLAGLNEDDHPHYLNEARHSNIVHHHGDLSGLSDDDHLQYLNDARHANAAKHPLGTVVPHDSHGNLSGVTPDQHHPQQHELVSPDHSATGLTPRDVLTAIDETTFAFQSLDDRICHVGPTPPTDLHPGRLWLVTPE